ncbi:MAG TPA: prolyl oligopeptidase family serine peptidase [Candidatus Limnocylindrales bacterium]|nr:prolyl oligopeptidase family serine peptidase [Candidatus Limnocylindrales bacterium]
MNAVPPAPRSAREDVADTWHGETLVDPYRWLEGESDRITEWTDAQNARTRSVLDPLPSRAAFAPRLRELLAVGLLGTPKPAGKWIFHIRREGSQKQAVLYVREGIAGKDRALVDPNTLDPSGLTTIDWYYPSFDGGLVAYGLSHGGNELSTLHITEVRTGSDCGDEIPHTQRSSVAWTSEGFYYTVHPAPGTVPPGDEHYRRRIRYHRLGDDPSRDELVFGEGRPKEDILVVQTSPDGRWALAEAFRGWVQSDVYLLDRRDPQKKWRTVVEGEEGLTTGLLTNDALWLRTNLGAPNYEIARAPLTSPERASWKTIVPETEHAIELFDVSRDKIALMRLVSATSRVSLWTHGGAHLRDVPLPGLGTVAGLNADPTGDLITLTYESFTAPAAAYAVTDTGLSEIVRLATPRGLDSTSFAVEQTTYASKDGTKVTMFLVHRSDVRPTGDVPTILSGYGGFNISRTPAYFPGVAAWVEAGGLFALPNLRGGGEYGERWHQAGMLDRKQNVFDDFLSAAEALVSLGWTKPVQLGISGGSNGGLLTGAALTQRPDLFGAVYCAVPLLDMLRYQRFLIARFWIAEYGSAEDQAQYRWLRAYSPYHHVREGVRYPAVLFTTAEGDSRVDPMHARKMTALMQSVTAEDPSAVVLLRVERDAGHGVGKPLDKQVEDLADQYSFFAWRLGLEPDRSGMLDSR